MMRTWVREYDVPGASVAVMTDTGQIRRLHYGGMSPNEPARIASLSKAITAVCAARLIDDGKLAFTDTLGKVLANTFARVGEPADPRFKTITIEQIQTHRAGLAREARHRLPSGRMSDGFKEALASPLAREPGAGMTYSNIGYLTLGVVIEAVSGNDYEDQCRRTALEPMGASGSIDPELRHRAPNGGWRISAVDYAKFVQVWDGKSGLLGSRSRSWMASLTGNYGLGTRFHRSGRGIRYFHSGRVASADRGGAYYYKFEDGWTVVVIFAGDIRREGRRALPRGLREVCLGR
jgi:CubicO group peptidase (beta-lactamase class C family)